MDKKLWSKKLVLIGASTGGPGHLRTILAQLPPELKTPIVIAQHMNAIFIPSFVQQFRTELKTEVFNLNQPLHVNKGGIYICEKDCAFEPDLPLRIGFKNLRESTLYNPSIDNLFLSAVPLCKKVDVMAILLTGIGQDGALGLKALFEAGAKCYGENEESAVVYGMPKQAKEINPELKMLSLLEIKSVLQRFC
jgi:two-component system chemotaxis response regulator CheB